MLEIVSMVIEEPLIEQMRASQAISLELDESTDVSLLRQLDLHIRYDRIFGRPRLLSFVYIFSMNYAYFWFHTLVLL